MAVTLKSLEIKLSQHLQALSEPRDPFIGEGHHRLAQQYIRSEMAQLGMVSTHPATLRGRTYYNYELTCEGTAPELSPIIVGAHYDTVPGSPGADDNASGVAVLLQLAELLSEKAQRPRRTVHLIAFDLEEYGLVGSKACVTRWQNSKRPLHLMLSLEMLGYFSEEPESQQYPHPILTHLYPDKGNFIALVGSLKTLGAMRQLKRDFGRNGMHCQWLPMIKQGQLVPATRRSDHAPFWDAGFPAILVTDTADLRNPYYHSARDRIETLNISAMARIAKGLATFLQNR